VKNTNVNQTKKIIRRRVVSQPSKVLKYQAGNSYARNPFLAFLGHFIVLGAGFLVGDLWLNHTSFSFIDLLVYPLTAIPNSIVYPYFLFKAFTGNVLLWKLTAAFLGYGFTSISFWYRFSTRFSLTSLNTFTFVGGIAMVLIVNSVDMEPVLGEIRKSVKMLH